MREIGDAEIEARIVHQNDHIRFVCDEVFLT